MNTELSHESLSQLIPWYANGTLSPEETAAVEAHLKGCAACRSEVQWMQEVSAAMADIAEEAPAVQPSFSKALAAVNQWERSHGRSGSPVRISRWFSAIWNPSVKVARFALAAQLALILGLGFFVLSHRTTEPGYTTLSGSEPSSVGGAKLTIAFTPETTIETIGQIMTTVQANIISGPSANGLYVIQLQGETKEPAVQAAVEKLRANHAIRFVEVLP